MVKQLRFLIIFLVLSVGGVWGQNVSFTTNPPVTNGSVNICLGQKVVFTNTTTGISSSATYNWVFTGGNPSTGNSSGPYEVTYANSGTFSATLTVNGTNYSINIIVGTTTGPTAALTLIPGSTGTSFTSYQGMTFFTKCGNSTSGNFQFNDANQSTYPTGTTQTIVWGDGGSTSSSPLPNPVSHIYSGAGIDYMTYTITFPNGCTSTANYGVFIGNSPPGLSINAAASESCIPGAYAFSLGGQNVPGTTFQVTFNDGSPELIYSSWAAIPSTITHTFNDVSCGVTSSVNNQSYPNSYSIQATATNACNPLGTYVGFGPIYVSEGPTPSFTTSPGSTVCINTNLTLSNNSLAGVNALPSGCNSDKGFYWEISPNTGYSLLPNSSLGSNNGQIGTLYDWTNWTNGSNDLNISFSQPGTYIIKLTLGNNCGPEFITDTICVMPAVTSQFSTNVITGCAPLQINTSNLSSTATCSGYSNNFTWSISNYQNPQNCQSYAAPTFLNNTTLNSLNPVLSFTEPGIYQLQLANELTPTLAGSSCASQTSTVTINVKDVPIVSLPAPAPICVTSAFNPLATVNSCYDSSQVNYSWNFGSNALPQLSNILNPSINYNSSGTYNYSLTANNICGSDTETQQITVQPSANINVGALGLSCEAGPVNLSGSITGGATTGAWTAVPNIGTFSPNSSSLNATFNPPIGTTGQIQLTLTSSAPPAPCPVVSQTVSLNINGQATANAGQDIAICQGQTVSLNGSVGGSATTGSWSTTGNGTFSSATTLNTTYTPGATDILNGSVNIILTTNDPGLPCTPKADTLHVTIKPNPTISESTLDSIVCSNEIFNISLSSNISNFPTSYTWNVVNPSALPSGITTTLSGTVSPPNNNLSGVITSSQSSPSTITYQIVGTTNGCPSQPIFQQVVINPTPIPLITPSGTSSFCAGSSTTLSASNSTTYLWSNNQTTQNITVSTPGTYSVVTTNQYGCQGQSASVIVSQVNLTTPLFTAIAPICSNGTFSLPTTSTNGITGTWSPAINNLATTTYTFTPSSGQCANTAQMIVTVNPLPNPTITANGPTTFCQGSSVVLTGTGGGTYAWNLNGSAIASATSANFTATQAGNYTVTVTNANGCVATSAVQTISVNPNPLPVILPLSPVSICTGSSMIISTGASFSNYTWYLGSSPNSLGSNDSLQITTAGSYTVSVTNSNGCTGLSAPFVLQTTAPITPTFTAVSPICAGGTFTLQNTSLNGITGFWSPAPNYTATTVYTFTPLSGSCATTSTLNVVVNPQPTVLANGVTICSGSSTTLNATPSLSGGTFSWSNGPTTQSNLVSPITNTAYTVNYTLNGCTASDTSQVVVIQTPSIVMTPATICAGQSTTISPIVSPTGGVFQWNTNATTASISVAPTSNTTYSLTYSVNGCQASQSSALITVNPVPTVSATSSSICSGQSALINATVSPTGGTYLWSTNQTSPSISVSPAATATYNLVYTVNGCASSPANVTINVTPLPVVSAPNYTICSGQSTTLNTTVNTPGGTYIWSPNTALSSNSVANPVASPNNTQIYTVTYAVNGCTSLPDSVVVSVIQSIQASVNNASICNGASATLTASPANANYLWSNGATSQSITINPSNSQSYTVTVSAAGCPSSNAISNVTVNPIPSVSVASVNAICNGSSATLSATPSVPNGTYLWSNGQTNNTINVSPALTSPTTAQNFNYSVVYTLNGCPSLADTVTVAVNPVPTVSLPTTTMICNGSGDTLVATVNLPGGTYSWSNGLTTPSIIVNPVSNTNYIVTYSLNGCNATSASTTGNVVVNPIPTVSVSGPASICAGQQATLTATPSAPGGSYLWSNGATSASINVSPTSTTTYSVVYTLNGCASAPFDKQVPVNPIPTISINDTTICGGLSVLLNPSVSPSGGSFLWSANASNSTTSQVTVTPATTTTYTLAYTANGCVGTENIQVSVIQNPVATLLSDTICFGQSTTLVASPNGANYSWSTGATTQSITVNPSVTSTYTVTVNIGGCAATSATAQVTVNPIPSVSVASVNAICNGSSATLTATPSAPNGTYLWSNGQTNNTINVSPALTSPTTAQNFNYSVVYTLNGCPSLADTVTVAVNPVPTVSLPTTTTICNGSGDTLVATVNLPGGTYSWSNGLTTPSIIVNPVSNTNYSVAYSLNGCNATSASTTGNVVVNPIPTVSVSGPASICAGQQATLTATPSAPGGSYLWSNGATSASINVSPTSTTTYSVVYTLNGCASAPFDKQVPVNPIPTISINDTTICGGLSVLLNPSVSPSGGTFLWSANASAATTSQVTVTPATTTTYTLAYTANGCVGTENIQVSVIQNPIAALSNQTICFGQSATLVASPNGANYSWSTGATTQSITVNPSVTSTYTVTVNIGGCAATSATAQVTVNPIPSVSVASVNAICNGSSATLTATPSAPNGTYLWSNGQTNNTINVSPALTSPTTAQNFNYSVVYTLNGCPSLADTVTVAVNPVPTVSLPTTTTICNGSGDTLVATVNLPGGTYSWSNGLTTPSIIVNPVSNTNYSVTYSLNGCNATSASTTGNVVVNPIPTVSVSGPASICAGQQATLTATPSAPGGSYLWSNGATSASINVSPTSTTTYSVVYTLNGCASAPFDKQVPVNPIPTISINDTTICGGLSVLLNPSVSPSGGSFLWSANASNSTTSQVTVTPATTTTYTLAYTANGCVGTENIQVSVIQNPVATLLSDTICFGQSTTLVASPNGANYSWSTGATTQSITVNPSVTSTYTVTVNIGGCAATSATAQVTVNPIPSVSVASVNAICNGSSATLTATPSAPNGTYLWSNGQTNNTINVSPALTSPTTAQNFNYSVVYTLNGCPSLADTVTVAVNPVPTVSLPTTTTICNGSGDTLVATVNLPGGTYSWSNGLTTPSIIVNPVSNTNYSVAYSLNGCNATSASTTGNVVVNPIPTVSVSGPASICAGQQATLTATPSAPGGSYLWSNGATSASINVSPTSTTTYSVVYTLNGCASAPFDKQVPVNPIPTISINDTTICGGLSVLLNPSVSPSGGTFLWSANASAATTSQVTVTPATTTTYTLAYTANGCVGTENIQVSVIQNPIAALSNQTICFGQSATLVASPNGANYSWSTGATTQSITVNPSVTSTYTVTVNIGGCAATSATATVTVNPIPSVSVASVNAICNGSSATLTATPSAPNGTYLWSNGQTNNTINVSPALTSPTTAQNFNYSVVYTLNGCPSLADTVTVAVNPVPTVSLPTTTTICNGSGDTLVATVNLPGGTYSWSNGLTTPSIIVNPVSNTNYSVAYSLNGCNATSASTTGNVVVNPIPTVSVSGPASICAGQQATLTATPSAPGGSYLWSNGATSASINVSPTSTTTYSVVYTLNGCASAPFDKQVPVNPIPTISINDTTICGGLSVLLNPSVSPSGGTFLWSANASAATTSQVTVTPATTTTYTLAYTANGCVGTENIQVSVIQNPIAALSNQTICFGQSATLVASPNGANYSWSTGATTQSITVNPSVTSTYTVTVNIGGCAATSATAQVTVNPIPSVSVASVNAICNGSSATLAATPSAPNGTYLWSNGQTNNTINVSPALTSPTTAQNFNYSVVYTLNGCPSLADTVTVAVNPVPTVSFNDTTICEGNNATLIGNPNISGGAFLWNNGASTQQINVSPSVTTNYTLIYNLNGCNDTVSEFVYVNPLPSAQINQNPTICYGTATTLTSSVSPVNGTYQWSGFGLSGVNNQNQVTVSPQNGNATQNTSHIYELVYTLNGCTDTAFTTVNVNLIPSVIGIASEDTICPGQNIQLSATGTPSISNGNNGSYSWSTANPISSIGNSAIVSVSPTTNTTYEVVYSINGCSSPSYPVAITIQTAPQITIQNNPNATICEGGCVTLTAVPAASTITPSGYSWSTGETTQSIQVCPTDTTQYTVIGLSGTCQSPVATTTVNVTGDPVISVNLISDTSMCVGGSFTFNVATTGGVGTPSYTWYLNNQPNNYSGAALPNSNNASYSTPTIIQPTTQYHYAMVNFPGVGCNQLTSDVAQLIVVADPIVALDPMFNQTLCEGGTATCIAPVVTGGVGNNTYLWLPTMSADEIFCPPTNQIGTQNYNVIVQQSGIGCGSIPSNTIAITVVADPTIQIVGTANVCEGAEVPLITTVQGGLGTISSYQWSSSYPNGNPYVDINGANAFNYTTFILEDQVGIAVNMNQSIEGCNASDTFLINVFEDPQVSIIGDSLTCMGLVNNLQTIVTGGVPNSTNTFTWFSPGTEQNPTPFIVQSASQQNNYDGTITSDTSYFVSVDNSGFGCDNDTSAVFEVGVVQWAVANFDIDPEIPSQSILNPTFSFINTSENSTSYLWDLGECDPQLPFSELYTSPTLTYNPNNVDQLNYTYGCSPGYYSVTLYAYNQGMCPDTVTQIIRIRDEVIVYVPNAFTPGEVNNTNEYFYPVITGKIQPGTYRFQIFNRWGELIFESKDPNEKWDGYRIHPLNGNAPGYDGNKFTTDFAQDGVYIWQLEFVAEETKDIVKKQGHVTLLGEHY